MRKNLHVFPHKNKWGIKGEGNTKFTKLFENQKSAVVYAKMIANRQKLKVFIHDTKETIDNGGINKDG
jgi:hypothetical protein